MTLRLTALLALGLTSAWSQPQNNFIYQIFVRSFADSPTDRSPKGEVGDLRGIREKLDYINDGRPGMGTDLEAGILWLMPIFPTDTYHGYDIKDYRAVNPDYGTLDDLRELVREAHRRGVRIILDIAFNHTSNRHPWFLDAVRDPASPFRSYYLLQPADGSRPAKGWRTAGNVRYFAAFGENMPDLNFDEPAVRAEVKAIAKFWLDQGIDGFRLDAAKHVYDEPEKNNQWWREFSDYVYSVNLNAVLVGEVLGKPEVLRSHAPGFHALLDAPFMRAARDHLAKPSPGFLRTWRQWINSYREVQPRFHPWVFLGSHDETPRLASFLQQQAPDHWQDTYRVGMCLLFSVARHPILYNGDELMQPGVKWPDDGSHIYDETIREPFPWFRAGLQVPQTDWFPPRYDKPNDGISVEEQNRRGSMLDLVRSLARLRVQRPDFANAEIDSVLADSAEWLAFTKGKYLILIRTNAKRSQFMLPDTANWQRAQVVFSAGGAVRLARAAVDVPPFGFVLLQMP
jgi:glycosidase